jgi:hypothetical protein
VSPAFVLLLAQQMLEVNLDEATLVSQKEGYSSQTVSQNSQQSPQKLPATQISQNNCCSTENTNIFFDETSLSSAGEIQSVSGDSTRKRIPPPIRGKPKSGRTWKAVQKPARDRVAIPALHIKCWQKKQKMREQQKAIKAIEHQLREIKEKKRREQLERIKRIQKQREENALKSATYQEIKNTSKIRKMSRKQLRSIRILADINKY